MSKINYQKLLDDSLRNVVRTALMHARTNGLGSDGCLHITFRTRGRGVTIPDFLKLRYPETMTIVLQWTFSNLNVSDARFGVTLHFDGRPFYIQVPFSEMTEFKDLEAEFMLSFSPSDNEGDDRTQELPLEQPATRDPRVLYMDDWRRKKGS